MVAETFFIPSFYEPHDCLLLVSTLILHSVNHGFISDNNALCESSVSAAKTPPKVITLKMANERFSKTVEKPHHKW
jgi:hypothetical protein